MEKDKLTLIQNNSVTDVTYWRHSEGYEKVPSQLGHFVNSKDHQWGTHNDVGACGKGMFFTMRLLLSFSKHRLLLSP